MPDKQPSFTVTFKELAVNAIKRQTRGHVILVLGNETDQITYRMLSNIDKAKFNENENLILKLCFTGNPQKVTILKEEENIDDLIVKLDKYDNYILCYPNLADDNVISIKNYLNNIRKKNNYSIAILANQAGLDSEYLVNFVSNDVKISLTGYTQTVSPKNYTARIAGALSGLASSRSLTYYELAEVIDVNLQTDIDETVANGGLTIIYQDGSYKLGRAVNSLVTYTDGITEAFSKIRIVNIMDMIANDIITTFRRNYVGKYVNNFANKKRFIGAVNTYLKTLANEGILDEANDNEVYLSYDKIKAFIEAKGVVSDSMSYEDIISYNTGSYVLLDGVCSPTDCMEDLNLGFYLFQGLESEE